jgi:hypothetical protein
MPVCRHESPLELKSMKPTASFRRLLQRVHSDERGAVSIETIMIIGAIAIPILIFLLRFGWPRIKDYFNDGMNDLEAQRSNVMSNG